MSSASDFEIENDVLIKYKGRWSRRRSRTV